MLHVAPEAVFVKLLADQVGDGYVTADLHDFKAMVKMDIMDIKYPDGTFDVIYCSHVLEHVVDDRKAMRELRRVLRIDGWAVLLVPIQGNHTIEDPAIVDPIERTRLFGQHDHVRSYGRDYVDRLREAGFTVETWLPEDFLEPGEIVRMGITAAAGEVFCCRRMPGLSEH